MLKILVLFLVLAYVAVRESNATVFDHELSWTEGSAVNITVGPEDALYCKLDNSRHVNVFEGFGPCRLTLDRVTQDHRGYWQLWYGSPGLVSVLKSNIFVNVYPPDVDTAPRITSSLKRHASTVTMTCSVPEEFEVVSCIFRDPSDYSYIASTSEQQTSSYRSVVERNHCSLELLKPQNEMHGLWRCAVHTTQDTRYNFIVVRRSILDPELIDYGESIHLRAKNTGKSLMEGEQATLFCSIPATVRYCYYRSPTGTVININPSTSSADYEYVGNGFDAGECGIKIKNLRPSDNGEWTCNVGVVNSTDEQRDYINVYINNRTMAYHRWQGNEVVVRLRIFPATELEYCRYVRNDGLAFTSEQVPAEYDFERYSMFGNCELHIPRPQAVDVRPWTVVAKIVGEDEEISVRTTIEPRPLSMRGIGSTTAIILWCAFGTIFIFLIVASFLPKKNRDWTAQRAARIRNSFRRQPQAQAQHNAANLPNYHITPPTQIDLPPKV